MPLESLVRILALRAGLGVPAMICALVGGGCASGRMLSVPRPADAASPTSPQIFVFRESQVPGAAITVPVEIDGTEVAELGSGDYLQFPVAAGPHIVAVTLSGREESQRVRAETGGRYFFHFQFEIMGADGTDVLRRLDDREGERELASGSYSKVTD